MKNRFLVLALGLLFSGGILFATINNDHTYEQIEVCGDGEGGGGIKPTLTYKSEPCIATLMVDKSKIETTFSTNLGNVNVIVEDESGLIYHKQNVNTSKGKRMTINISILPAGKYKIEYVDSSNNLINKGNFEIK